MKLTKEPDYFLDITKEVCPFTFVRMKLLLERMVPGEIAEIKLQGAEPLGNVPKSAEEYGCLILSLVPEDKAETNGRHSLFIQRL